MTRTERGPFTFRLDMATGVPVYRQIMDQVMGGIASGTLHPGDQLPTVRQLAVDLRINANTVAKVYAFLERAGLLETRRGVGTFVAAHTPTPQEGALRRTELTRLVDRFLAELSHHGFHLAEVMPEIERRRQQGA